jgi:hypothetical protein
MRTANFLSICGETLFGIQNAGLSAVSAAECISITPVYMTRMFMFIARSTVRFMSFFILARVRGQTFGGLRFVPDMPHLPSSTF